MKKIKQIALAVSIVTFFIGLAIWCGVVQVAPQWTIVMPVSAIAFGVFLIWLTLEKEAAKFDEEEAKKISGDGHRPHEK